MRLMKEQVEKQCLLLQLGSWPGIAPLCLPCLKMASYALVLQVSDTLLFLALTWSETGQEDLPLTFTLAHPLPRGRVLWEG